jgi:hypothetical protein
MTATQQVGTAQLRWSMEVTAASSTLLPGCATRASQTADNSLHGLGTPENAQLRERPCQQPGRRDDS